MATEKTFQKTFVMIKPASVARGLVGKIIGRFEEAGLKIVAMKMKQATKEDIEGFYPSNDKWFGNLGNKTKKRSEELGIDYKKEFGTSDLVEIGKIVKGWLVEYNSSSPVVLMIIKGNNAVEKVRKLVGYTDPISAEPGSMRNDFTNESIDWANFEGRVIYNIIHASDSPEEAQREINHWFLPEEIYNYKNAFDLVMDKFRQ